MGHMVRMGDGSRAQSYQCKRDLSLDKGHASKWQCTFVQRMNFKTEKSEFQRPHMSKGSLLFSDTWTFGIKLARSSSC
jgi:hypothetical protein